MPYFAAEGCHMTYSEDDIKARAEAIVEMALKAGKDSAVAEALAGQLLTQEAHKHPLMYFFAAEALMAGKHIEPAVRAWHLFIEFLEEYAQTCQQDTVLYADSVAALQSFLVIFAPDDEALLDYEIFSDKINASIDYFDEVTIGDRPAERMRSDQLLMGDRAMERGEVELAVRFYKQAADEGREDGWLRLLQLMSERDIGEPYGLAAAQDICEKAVAAGLWHARAYYLLRLTSSADSDNPQVITGEQRSDMARETAAFIDALSAYAAPMGPATGFSKYLAPVVRRDSVLGIFSEQKPEDIIARLEASARANDIKAAVSAFLPVMVYMRRQGWIDAGAVKNLPSALDRFEGVLKEENALIAQTKAQSSEVAGGSFEVEQQIFHDMAIQINQSITASIAEAKAFLSETV